MTPSPPETRPDRCTCGWFPQTEDEYFDRLRSVEAELRELQEAHQAAMRELERASDVRANRTRIIGNAHMILAASSEEPG